jgi:hypothetical protein
MDVHIDEISTQVRVLDGEALLTPQVLEQIVRAVLQRLETRQRTDRIRQSETRIRSVVEQQEERRSGG